MSADLVQSPSDRKLTNYGASGGGWRHSRTLESWPEDTAGVRIHYSARHLLLLLMLGRIDHSAASPHPADEYRSATLHPGRIQGAGTVRRLHVGLGGFALKYFFFAQPGGQSFAQPGGQSFAQP
jgi:hypothetical protein